MRLPRMTTRRWMVAVAVVAVACAATIALMERSRRFAHIARHHAGALPVISYVDIVSGDETRLSWGRCVTSWHAQMAKKYQYAARYPWLPVEPDPPRPEP